MAQGGIISSNVPSSSPQFGSGVPSMLRYPPRGDSDLYIDISSVATEYRGRIWAYDTTIGYWYPTAEYWLAKTASDDITISEAIVKTIIRDVEENLTVEEALTKIITKVLAENINITEALIKAITKTINETINITETLAIRFQSLSALNGSPLNTGALN